VLVRIYLSGLFDIQLNEKVALSAAFDAIYW